MKTLLLMRHGKSSWKHPELSDQERPLSKRGERDSHFMSRFIVERELVPQIVLASSSVRTAKTAEALCEECTGIGPVRLMDELYLAEAGAYMDALRTLPAEMERALIIGHNPGLESLLMILGRRIEAMPTTSLAHLVLPIQSWGELTQETEGELVDFWKPQDLQQQLEEEAKKE
jgi:phosphohistidine phosphatase